MTNNVFIARIAFLFLLISTVSTSPRLASAETYRYKDDAGVVHYVEDISEIPEQYRAVADAPPSEVKTDQSKNSQKEEGESRQERLLREYREMTSPSHAKVPDRDEIVEDSSSAAPQVEVNSRLGTLDIKKDIGVSPGALKTILIFFCVVMLINIVSFWILLNRAGYPGFGIIIPIYNAILLSRLGGHSGWWILWFLVPYLGPIIWGATVHYNIARHFDRSVLFGIGTIFFPWIFIPIIAFSGK